MSKIITTDTPIPEIKPDLIQTKKISECKNQKIYYYVFKTKKELKQVMQLINKNKGDRL